MRKIPNWVRATLIFYAMSCQVTILSAQRNRPHQSRQARVSHGTVNIILANKSGLVAITDSRLSNNNHAVGEGQKLFLVDDHTICTIAGWFSNSGPTSPDIAYPFATTIPNLMSEFLKGASQLGPMTLEQKALYIANTLAFSMGRIEEISEAASTPGNNSSLQLTVAGVEGVKIKIERLDLFRTVIDNHISFEVHASSPTVVTDILTHSFAGLSDVAESVMARPDPKEPDGANLAFLRESVKSDGGASLSLDDLTHVARQLEIRSSRKYPSVVGGSIQIAKIENGVASLVEMPVFPDSPKGLGHNFMFIAALTLSANPPLALHMRGVSVATHRAAVVHDVRITGLIQPLDKTFFFRSTFDNCILIYQGSSDSIFDKSNEVDSCKLVLRGGVDMKSRFVSAFHTNFPNVKIERDLAPLSNACFYNAMVLLPPIGDPAYKPTPFYPCE